MEILQPNSVTGPGMFQMQWHDDHLSVTKPRLFAGADLTDRLQLRCRSLGPLRCELCGMPPAVFSHGRHKGPSQVYALAVVNFSRNTSTCTCFNSYRTKTQPDNDCVTSFAPSAELTPERTGRDLLPVYGHYWQSNSSIIARFPGLAYVVVSASVSMQLFKSCPVSAFPACKLMGEYRDEFSNIQISDNKYLA